MVKVQLIAFRLEKEQAHKLRVYAVTNRTSVQKLMVGCVDSLLEPERKRARKR